MVQIARERPETNSTYAALDLLGRMKRADDMPVLADSMTREHGSLSWAAAKALALHSSPEAKRALVDALGNANDEVVSAAVIALGTSKAESARGAIEKLLDHATPGVRHRATLALGELGAGPSIAVLWKHRAMEHDTDVIGAIERIIGH